MPDLATLLNPEQLRAARHVDGPLLILAGAGSGKTRVLVHRVYNLIEIEAAKPWQIMAVTFTNKAAQEMKDRLQKLLGPSVRDAWIGTFHSICARLLRIEGERLGFDRSFTIYDVDDARRLVKSILQEVGHEAASKAAMVNGVLNEIDRAKNDAVEAAEFAEQSSPYDTPQRRAARKVYPRYQRALMRSNAMDFGDLLLWTVHLLKKEGEVRERLGERFRFVMVDEFQDTNRVQYDFLRLLVATHRNLAVVGDDDQSIYRWRGADVSNILDFPQAFPTAEVVKLETNYRSSRHILGAANAVIRHNSRRHPKTLRTDAEDGAPVKLALVNRSEEEAALVARTITDSGRPPSDFAVLYRSNAQSRLFEEAFMRAEIPYALVGGTGFYERMEVKDILAYLRVTANPSSRSDFARIVNTPTRGIGTKTVERLRKAGEAHDREGAELLSLPDGVLTDAGLSAGAIKKLRVLDRKLSDWRELAETTSATEVASRIIEDLDYLGHLEKSDPTTAEDRAANVSELVNSIAEFEDQIQDSDGEEGIGLAGARTPLQAFLDGAALVSPADTTADGRQVMLMTLHSAKGLEFPVVFMVGMEERTFPSQRAVDDLDPESLEEERRLCYVGMTRAEEELILVAARFRRMYGREEVRLASRFLGELPDGIVETLGGARLEDLEWSSGRAQEHGPSEPYVEYDLSFQGEPDPYSAPEPTRRGGSGALQPGAQVVHNLFGTGTVVESDGGGSDARLTIDFPDAGRKRVVARFVRPVA
ncbi:MAG: UvrD-helicase domain-containing protein [Myxococcota bacterium]